MTPQDTANKIISKYFIMLRHDKLIEDVNLHTAKKCALVAVDEMLEELDHLAFDDHDYGTSKMMYWQEVKQEINKL